MPMTLTPAQEWATLRPRFERFLFRVGYHEAARMTGCDVATVYRLANDRTRPQPRTLRDVRAAVESWERDSQTQR
ncbi:MAG: hypothetical protein MUC63_10435 [Planctomycetes bacterium]|nr:hypothetical protein [Planctomycetota bacterium]